MLRRRELWLKWFASTATLWAMTAAMSAAVAQPIVPVNGQVFTTSVQFVPGTYQFPSGLYIGAPGITVDINGSTLIGSNYNGYGITCVGYDDVVIKNGTIRGYFYGVQVHSVARVHVLDNNLSGNYVDPASLTKNPPPLNINAGPFLGDRTNLGGGLFMSNVIAATVARNTMRNGENGIDLYNVTASTIDSNDASDNTGWGIHLNASSGNTIRNNAADRCTRVGLLDSAGFLLVNGSNGNLILDNSFQGSGDGFFIGNEHGCPSNDNIVQGNNGSNAGANAFEATFSSGNQFIGNIANDSNYGFWLGYSHDGNVIQGNTIHGNNVSGIEIEHGQNNTIENNDIVGNGGTGIVLRTDGEPHFPPNTGCLDLPNPAASSGYTIRGNRIHSNFGPAMNLQGTTDSLIVNNLFGGPFFGTVSSDGANNIWSVNPTPGTNIVGGATLGGNWWFDYFGGDQNGDGLGDTDVPYTNGGQIAAPGDPHPLIGSPDLGELSNPRVLCDHDWTDLGRNTRSTGVEFDTANGTHFATDGADLYLLEGMDSPLLSRFDPSTSRYIARAPAPEGVEDGGDFQFASGAYYATVGVGFDTTTGAGNGSKLYRYVAGSNSWTSRSSTTVAGQLVCNEALAYDSVANRLYATIVRVKDAAHGGDPSLLAKLAIYNPVNNTWTGTTSAALDTWGAGSEAEYLDGRIYVWRGGLSGGAVNGSDSYLDVYHIATNTWTRTPSLQDAGVIPGFRTGGFDGWGISLSSDVARRRIFVMGAETNRQLYVFDVGTQTWGVAPIAPYDSGWGASIEYVAASDKLYQIDGRDSAGRPQGTASFAISSGELGCSAPPVPNGLFGDAMTASRMDPAGGTIELHWDVSGCAAAGYHVLHGALSTIGSYVLDGGVCGLGRSGSYSWSEVPAGNHWFVVVGDDGGELEGSWGTDSFGQSMNGTTPSGQCGISLRDNSETCP